MQYTAVLFVCVAVVGFVQGEDECMPPKPGEKMVHHGDCCKVKSFIPDEFMANAKKCREKFPPPPRPTGPPPSGGPPLEMRNKMACMGECIFKENDLLTTDKQLDQEAVKKTFVSSDSDLSPVLMAAVDKCLGSYQDLIDKVWNCQCFSLIVLLLKLYTSIW